MPTDEAEGSAPMPGCYLCRPDDPDADEEACTACDRAFFDNPVLLLADD